MATKAPAPATKGTKRFPENRKRRLERTLKEQPNNEQAKLALTEHPSWLRKKPTTPYWSHSMIREAKIIKEFTGKMDLTIFSSIDSIRGNARLHIASEPFNKAPEGKVSFSLATRAHNRGVLVWG